MACKALVINVGATGLKLHEFSYPAQIISRIAHLIWVTKGDERRSAGKALLISSSSFRGRNELDPRVSSGSPLAPRSLMITTSGVYSPSCEVCLCANRRRVSWNFSRVSACRIFGKSSMRITCLVVGLDDDPPKTELDVEARVKNSWNLSSCGTVSGSNGVL